MKTHLRQAIAMFPIVLLLLVMLGVAGCISARSQPAPKPVVAEPPVAAPAAVPEPTVDPAAAVVLTMIDRVNAEDYVGAAELVSEDLMAYFVGMPPTGMEIYWGKAQFQTFLEECCTGQNFVWEVAPQRVEDGVVYAESKTWMDFTRQLGVAPNNWHEIFVVEDGKIALYASILTEESLANFKPVLLEAIPELAQAMQPPTTIDEAPATEVTVTIANGTCTYTGPMTLQAGEVTVNAIVEDENWEKYAVSFFTLDEGKDLVDLMASTYRPGPPSWSHMVFLKEMEPNESQSYTGLLVEEGALYVVCWAGSPDIAIGNAGPFVVVK